MLNGFKDGAFVRSWYEDRVQQFGDDIRSLGFNQRSSQQLRFAELLKVGNLEKKSILDIGCGLGDFLDYLVAQGVDFGSYTGVDLSSQMIELCRARPRSPSSGAVRFEAADVMEYRPSQQFDYVVASGIFGLDTDHMRDRIAPTMERLFSWCKDGLAMNFLSSKSPRPAPGRLYVDPAQILGAGLNLTPAATLSHTYLPNDFTLFLYRVPTWASPRQSETTDAVAPSVR